jgi:hypothetical protein
MSLTTNDQSGSRLFSLNKPPSLQDFKKLTTESVPAHYPLASTVSASVPIYDLPEFSSLSPEERSVLQDEWYHFLLSGPGVFVTKRVYKDNASHTVNAATTSLEPAQTTSPNTACKILSRSWITTQTRGYRSSRRHGWVHIID